MRFSLLAAAASLLATTQARIDGVGIPDQIEIGGKFNATLFAHNYIQRVEEVAVAVGCAPSPGYPDSLGLFQESMYLGPEQSNVIRNITFEVSVPDTFPEGPAVCQVAVYTLLGAVYWPNVEIWNVTVTAGNETSDDIVTSY